MERNEKMLKQLKANYEMYEKTKKDSENRMRHAENPDGTKKYTDADIANNLEMIKTAQDDVVAQYKQFGGDVSELGIKLTPKPLTGKVETPVDDLEEKAREVLRQNEEERKAILDAQASATATRIDQQYIPPKGTYSPQEAFDIIRLPSKGEGYKEKIGKVSVAYLTAYDENMIVSPNLYRDNLILDYIIQEKLLSKEIDPLDLLEGDRDAIVLFLRANGYGNEYPITATDDATGKEFEAIIDLSQLKYKEFNLKGDSNGWFPFTLPVSKREVKFRFPTHRDTLILEKMENAEEPKIMKERIKDYVRVLNDYMDEEKMLSTEDKPKVRKAINTIEKWGDSLADENTLKYNHTLTNKMNLLIMAVDGITDKKYINEFIRTMNVRDAAALRKYMNINEPGIDYTITVNRPEELGGGSISTFLQLDKFLFLNITD